jgi:hypothetical protein
MTAMTFDLAKDIFLLVFFLAGALWMWGVIRLPQSQQAGAERLCAKSRT